MVKNWVSKINKFADQMLTTMRSEVWIFVFFFGINIISGLNIDIERTRATRVPAEKLKKEIRAYIQSQDNIDPTNFLTYYNVRSKSVRKMLPGLKTAPELKKALRMPFLGGPCNCHAVKCECCSDFHMHGLNRKTCTDLLYDPEMGTVNMKIRVAGDFLIYDETFQAEEAQTICLDVPVPYMEKGIVDMCVGFYNVTIEHKKLHMCMAVNSRLNKRPVLVLFFDCMNMAEDQPHVHPGPHGHAKGVPFFNKFPSTFPPYTNPEDMASQPYEDESDDASDDNDESDDSDT